MDNRLFFKRRHGVSLQSVKRSITNTREVNEIHIERNGILIVYGPERFYGGGDCMKKTLVPVILIAIYLLGTSACSSNHEAVTESITSVTGGESSMIEYKNISAKEAKEMIDAGNVIILDVRTQDEYNSGHIAEAIRLEAADFEAKAAEVLPDKDATVLVYCRSGKRSKTAAKMLLELGYTDVYDFGGINDWPYETVK